MKAKATRRRTKADPNSLTQRIREVVRTQYLTALELARTAGLAPGIVQRFLTGQRDIRLATADRLAAMSLRLVESGRGRARTQPVGVGPSAEGGPPVWVAPGSVDPSADRGGAQEQPRKSQGEFPEEQGYNRASRPAEPP